MEAFAPMSVTLLLEDEIDVSRGDMIVRENNAPQVGQDIDLMLCWLHEKSWSPGTGTFFAIPAGRCVA